MVAMYTATHGRRFEEKVGDELQSMNSLQKSIYGTICVASAYRLYLRKEDIAIAFSEHGNTWLSELNKLESRKMILKKRYDAYSGRHRIVDQFVFDALRHTGELFSITKLLIKIGASKTTPNTPKSSQVYRLLRVFTNHNFIKNAVGPDVGREIYNEFEEYLEWSSHFWLHRGALELEENIFDRAELFLKTARGIDRVDPFIDTELAYLDLKKALKEPSKIDTSTSVKNAIDTLDQVCIKQPSYSPHACHILGSFALEWVDIAINDPLEKSRFLNEMINRVSNAKKHENEQKFLDNLTADLKRKLLQLAVKEN